MMGRHTPAHLRAIVTAVALLACSVISVSANDAKGTRPPSEAGTRILGTAWKADNTPIPEARLRLRNVTTGRMEATTVANGKGQFGFTNIEPDTYVVELVNEDGKVLAISKVFSVTPGETIATFVRLSARAPWFSGFFSNAATSAVAAASSLGVTAVGSDGQPVSAAPGNGQ